MDIKAKLLHVMGNNTGEMCHAGGTEVTRNADSITYTSTDKGYIYIKKFRYIDRESSHALKTEGEKFYKRIHSLNFKGHYVYYFNTYAKKDDHGIHVGLTWFQNQRFLWKQSDHWFQKEDNIRYVVNILFLILGSWIAYKSI